VQNVQSIPLDGDASGRGFKKECLPGGGKKKGGGGGGRRRRNEETSFTPYSSYSSIHPSIRPSIHLPILSLTLITLTVRVIYTTVF
jgi:hypothetical protein